jgi:hypothetical protein
VNVSLDSNNESGDPGDGRRQSGYAEIPPPDGSCKSRRVTGDLPGRQFSDRLSGDYFAEPAANHPAPIHGGRRHPNRNAYEKQEFSVRPTSVFGR